MSNSFKILVKGIMRVLVESYLIIAWIIPAYFFAAIVINSIFLNIFSEFGPLDRNLTSISAGDLTRLLIGLLLLLFGGILIQRRRKKISWITPVMLSKTELFSYLISAYFFAFYFQKSLFDNGLFVVVSRLLMTLLFFLFLPQVVLFYETFSVSHLFNSIIEKKDQLIKNISPADRKRLSYLLLISAMFIFLVLYLVSLVIFYIKNIYGWFGQQHLFIILTVIIIIFFLLLPRIVIFFESLNLHQRLTGKINRQLLNKEVISFDYDKFKRIWYILFASTLFAIAVLFIVSLGSFYITKSVYSWLEHERKLKENLTILSIEPQRVIAAEEVIIEGYNFGFRNNDRYKLQSNYGPVGTSDWINEKISFIVPLHLQPGKISLWLERPKGDSSTSALIRSNQVNLEIMSRFEFNPNQEDFEGPFLDTFIKRGFKKIKKILLLRRLEP